MSAMELVKQLGNSTWIGVGFGTAALGHNCHSVVSMALHAGFRKFDTAEADWWYDQKAVGRALHGFYEELEEPVSCQELKYGISTKIPPWKLTSFDDIRNHASKSRMELVGYCPDVLLDDGSVAPYPLDVYFIHAPRCWDGWHPRCKDPPPTLGLRDTWMAMEAVVGLDRSAQRIGLSNIWPNDLLDIIAFVKQRQEVFERNGGVRSAANKDVAPPRMPDAIQIYADPLRPARELRSICEEHGIEFVSYSTLGTQHSMAHGGSNPVLTHPTVIELAEKYSRSVAEVVLSWARQSNMSVIPRSSKKHHIDELARLLTDDSFLTEEDVLAIDRMGGEPESEEL